MGEYVVPADAPVSASWQDHKNRNPPSSEPGTDIACAYGTPIAAPFGGYVIEIKTSNSGGMGRYVALALDDGRTTRAIHLSEVWAWVGQRYEPGGFVGLSGASGYGSDWYYGPHVHQTLWPTCYWCLDTIDFWLYIGEPEPDPEPEPPRKEDDMPIIISNTAYGNGTDPGYFLAEPGALVLAENHNVINAMRAANPQLVIYTVGDNDLNSWVYSLTGISAEEFARFDPAHPDRVRLWAAGGS